MKPTILLTLLSFLVVSCGCGHKDTEHVPDETIPCVVDNKSRDSVFNPVIQMNEWEYNVTFRNIETGNTLKINKRIFYEQFEVGDTVYQIVHHCPNYKVEIKKIEK